MYRYIGKGEHWEGVPAHDLSDEQFAALRPDQRELVSNGRLYRFEPASPSPVSTPDASAPALTGEFVIPS